MAIFAKKNALKIPILGDTQFVLASDGQFDAPPPYFAVPRLKTPCVLGLGSHKMGDSGPPPPLKKAILCHKKRPKMPILGQKQGFLGSDGQFDAPPPNVAGA